MTTKELIEYLELQIAHNRASIPHHGCFRAIINTLKEYDTLVEIIDTCYLGIVKAYTMLRLGEMKDEHDTNV